MDEVSESWEFLTNLRKSLERKRGKRRNLRGRVFGRLSVKEATGKRTKSGSAIWRCLCECGGTKEVCANNLLKGKVKSCGCLYEESIHRASSTWKPPT